MCRGERMYGWKLRVMGLSWLFTDSPSSEDQPKLGYSLTREAAAGIYH